MKRVFWLGSGARKLAMTGMKALMLHQVTRATMASERPPQVRARNSGVNNSPRAGGVSLGDHSLDSLILSRSNRATAAGKSPVRNTARQDKLGSLAMPSSCRVNRSLTNVAKNRPTGADV